MQILMCVLPTSWERQLAVPEGDPGTTALQARSTKAKSTSVPGACSTVRITRFHSWWYAPA